MSRTIAMGVAIPSTHYFGDTRSVHHASIGGVAVECTQMEYHVQSILWRLTGLPSNIGRCITQHMSFQALVDAILSVASETPQYEAAVPELKRLLLKCNPLRQRRNEVVHAQWATIVRDADEPAPPPLQADEAEGIVTKAKGELTHRIIRMSFDDIAKIAVDMRAHTGELVAFVRANLPERSSFS